MIFLTASGDEYSVVAGLDIGADDYISKPFRPRELLSRIKSVLRRSMQSGAGRHDRLAFDDILIDTEKAQVTRAGNELYLSALEYRLLLIFANNPGIVLSRERILSELWDASGEFVNDNTLTVYISGCAISSATIRRTRR